MAFPKLNSPIYLIAVMVSTFACAQTPAKEEGAEIFNWYDMLGKKFSDGKVDEIVAAFAPDFTQIAKSGNPISREKVVAYWKSEPAKRGIYSNGPFKAYVSKLTVTDKKAIVEGLWTGSWRAYPNGPNFEQGMSFQNKFTSEWRKTTKGWQMVKFDNSGKYLEPTEQEWTKIKADHEEFKKKFGKA